MHSMSLGMVADFDERAGDHAAAVEALDQAIATNDSLGLRGFLGSLHARLGWSLLHVGDPVRAEVAYDRALEGGRRLRLSPVLLQALAGMAIVHRLHGRSGAAREAATEALELYLAGGPRRFKNRIDMQTDVLTAAAACCTVLAALAAEAGEAERAARLLGHAERLHGDAEAVAPPFLQRDAENARDAAEELLGHDGFVTALEAGRHADLATEMNTSR
jgi:tetratricopeptide (TPR) repeat protein